MKETFWSGKKKLFFVLLYIVDVLAFAASAVIASELFRINIVDAFYVRYFIFLLLILILTYSNYGLYDDKRNLFDDSDFMNLLYSSMITFFVLLIFIIMFNPQEYMLIIASAVVLAFTLILTTIGRLSLNYIVCLVRKKGYDVKRTIFFGDKKDDLLKKILDKHLGYNIIAVTQDMKVLQKHLENAEIVFIRMESINDTMLNLMINNDRINWKIISSILNLVIEPVAFDEFKDYPIINITNKDNTSGYQIIKRILDIILSSVSLIVLSPIFLLVAIMIKITMPGPIFYKHERLGKGLKPFMLYKFRSMRWEECDFTRNKYYKNEVKGLFKMKDDPRITPFGKILRRTCIDELAQLINIFKGDMSLVGPRPHLRTELPNYKGWRIARFNVMPGLTGLWQVNGRHELNFDKAVLYDIYYVKHMSIFLDITIMLKTIPSILMTRGRY